MNKKTLLDLDTSRLDGVRVVVRADLNVPLEKGRVTDDTRIRASLATLRTLTQNGASVVLLSHLGRPKGAPDPAYSLKPVAARLAELVDGPVRFVASLVGGEACEAVNALAPGEILLLENTRFHPGETEGDPELARALAGFGDLFVNDAFGSAHRAHASTTGIADAMRDKGGEAVAGHLLAKELEFLGRTVRDPERPFVAILGGAKISGKIDVIEALLPRVDRLVIGGAMANTFFRALGLETGASLVEDDRVDMAREILEAAGERLMLPTDCVVGDEIAEGVSTRIVPRDAVEADDRIGDIGTASRDAFAREIAGAATVVWNGPMGVFELEAFRAGTVAVAQAVADATDAGALSVLGGGDSAAAAEVAGVTDRLSHVSTGGGASLEFLAGADLPGVAALSEP